MRVTRGNAWNVISIVAIVISLFCCSQITAGSLCPPLLLARSWNRVLVRRGPSPVGLIGDFISLRVKLTCRHELCLAPGEILDEKRRSEIGWVVR